MIRSHFRAATGIVLLALSQLAAFTPIEARSTAPLSQSQGTKTAAGRPWLYENSDVPIDKAWRFGVLPNGLRYAVRRNGVPPGQVSIRLRVDVGSLMERPDERGFAHFMEHLTFRGSRHVPDGESKRIWQRLGVSFGSDSNAQTTPTGTSYALDLPEATAGSVDESLKILAGMMAEPNIVPAAVAAERAVVLAEMREGVSAASKVSDATRSFIFAGQPLAERNPIGSAADLAAADAARLQAFHDRWYRPSNVVLAVVGDADPAQLEELIRKNFADWKNEGATAPIPDFGRPDPNAPQSQLIVQPGATRNISLMWMRPWSPKADTIAYNQDKLIDMVALQMVNRRLEQAARDGKVAFLTASADQQDISRSVDGTFISIMPAGSDWAKALSDVRAVIEDAKASVPTKAEIEREYAAFDAMFAIQVENRDTEPGGKLADDLISAVDIRETTVSSQAALDIFRAAKPKMTPEKILASTRRLFSGDAFRAVLVLPEEDAKARAQLAQVLLQPVQRVDNLRLTAKAATMKALPPLGKPGKIVARQALGPLGMEAVTFANGVKLVLFANDAETGKVRINVRFGRGMMALSPVDTGPSWAGGFVIPGNGIGKLSQREIDEITNGRRIDMGFGIDDNGFELAAVSRPADYKDQLQLFATKMAFPGWDAAPVERLKSALLAAYDSSASSPGALLGRDLNWLLRNKDARFRSPDRAEIAALTPEQFRSYWEPLLASGPVEVQIFGDVKANEAIAAVAATLGALPPRPAPSEVEGGDRISFPAHNATPLVLRHMGDADQAAAAIAWPTGAGIANARESRQLDVLAQIISDRLFEKLRSADGAAYSPSAQSNYPLAYRNGQGYLLVMSQLKPDKIGYFTSLVQDIARDLATRPVSDDELQRTIAPMQQWLSRASTSNVFWMEQVAGATSEPRTLDALLSLGRDLTKVTPDELRALAAKFLKQDTSYSVVVLPQAGGRPDMAAAAGR